MGNFVELKIKDYRRKLDTVEQVAALKLYSITTVEMENDQPDCLTLDYWCKSVIIDIDFIELIGGLSAWDVSRVVPIQIKSTGTEVEKILNSIKERDTTLLNTRLHVSVPNLGLLVMNSVSLLQDACTDALQRKLDEGWRILAICPQPDQRRPDYILGRHEQA